MNAHPDALARLVAEGHTSLDRRTAAERGITPSMLRHWTAAGHLEPLGYGVYLIRTASTPATPWERERERHLAVATAVLDAAPTASLCGPSAVLAHGLPLLTIPTHVAVALRPHARCARRHVVVHRPWGGEPVDAFGLRAQPAAHAVVETSARLGVEAGLVAADAAARTGLPRGEILEALDEFGQRTGVAAARAVVEHVDGRRESPAESRAAYCFLTEGIAVRPQVVITDEAGSFIARVDFLIEGTRLVIEIDGPHEVHRRGEPARGETASGGTRTTRVPGREGAVERPGVTTASRRNRPSGARAPAPDAVRCT